MGWVCGRKLEAGGRPLTVDKIYGRQWEGKFWKDRWCGNLLLGESFIVLFFLVTTEDAWVAEV